MESETITADEADSIEQIDVFAEDLMHALAGEVVNPGSYVFLLGGSPPYVHAQMRTTDSIGDEYEVLAPVQFVNESADGNLAETVEVDGREVDLEIV